jgi:hypothetical protein
MGVSVALGRVCVGSWVSVDGDVNVGTAVGTKNVEVGSGVNVGKSKSNKGVGVASIAGLGKTLGLDTTFAGLRDRNRPIGIEQRQQNASRSKTGKRILPICPCWLYVLLNAERRELIWSIITGKTQPTQFYPLKALGLATRYVGSAKKLLANLLPAPRTASA